MATDSFLNNAYLQVLPDDSPITMDLVFGAQGVSPDYQITLGGAVLPGFDDVVVTKTDIPLGNGNSLNNKQLVIIGTIDDVAGASNVVSLDLDIKGAAKAMSQAYKTTVTTGSVVSVYIRITFYQ